MAEEAYLRRFFPFRSRSRKMQLSDPGSGNRSAPGRNLRLLTKILNGSAKPPQPGTKLNGGGLKTLGLPASPSRPDGLGASTATDELGRRHFSVAGIPT